MPPENEGFTGDGKTRSSKNLIAIHFSGAKAHVHIEQFAARLKSCPFKTLAKSKLHQGSLRLLMRDDEILDAVVDLAGDDAVLE